MLPHCKVDCCYPIVTGVFPLDQIIVFLLSGLFPMSAAIAASKLMKLPADEHNVKRMVLLLASPEAFEGSFAARLG